MFELSKDLPAGLGAIRVQYDTDVMWNLNASRSRTLRAFSEESVKHSTTEPTLSVDSTTVLILLELPGNPWSQRLEKGGCDREVAGSMHGHKKIRALV